MHKPVHTLCWWLATNGAVFIDAHDVHGDLVRFGFDEPATVMLPQGLTKSAAHDAAYNIATAIAQFFGAAAVVHDTDSEGDIYQPEELS